ncbi:MAG: ABC transporter substrate-binding protein [Actinomycetota bacterium]
MSEQRNSPRTRWCVGLVTLVALVVACGSSDVDDAASATSSTTVAPPDTPVEEVPATTSPAADYPRIVEHALGVTTIDERPERIVAVAGVAEFDALLSLGVEPVAVATRYPVNEAGDWGFAPWNAALLDEYETFENFPLLDPEDVAAFGPDIIVGQGPSLEQQYDVFSELAPTIAHADPADWRDVVRLFAVTFAVEARGEEVIAEIEAGLAEQARRIADDPPTVAFVSPFGGELIVYDADAGPGPARVMADVGLDVIGVPGGSISYEQMDLLADADWILVFDFTLGPVDELFDDPLFGRLPAVEAGRAVRLDPRSSFSWIYETTRSLPEIVDGVLTTIER